MSARAAGAPFALDAFLARERAAAERALLDLPYDGVPAALRPAIEYAVGSGGKRLRPILCAAAWRSCAGVEPGPAVYRIAASIELIHAYSLAHDDLPFMDDDDLRRGRPTTHRVHGVATTTVAGAAMIALAFRVLANAAAQLGLDAHARERAVSVLAEGAGAAGMVGGQWLDLEGERRALALAELERIHALKTGALIAAAVRLGGIAAGSDARQDAALAGYGQAVGLAFQIADDLLDERGDSVTIGKTAGRDAALQKSTYPALLGIAGAEDLARQQVERALGALEAAGLESPELEALARFAVERVS